MFGPTILGEKCVLGAFDDSELERMQKSLQDQEIIRFLQMDHPPTLEDERAWFRNVCTCLDAYYWGIWVPDEEGNSSASECWTNEEPMRLVGTSSLEKIDWHNQRGETGTLVFDKSVWGKGIASEMMKLRLNWIFTHLPLRKVCSGYLDGNEGSAKMQARAGYQIVGRRHDHFFRDGQWRDHIHTEITREEWLSHLRQ